MNVLDSIFISELRFRLCDNGRVIIERPLYYGCNYYGSPKIEQIKSFDNPFDAAEYFKDYFLKECRKAMDDKIKSYEKLANEYKSKKSNLSQIKSKIKGIDDA